MLQRYLEVFSLIKEMKDKGKIYEDIHLALRAGNRGNLPMLPSEDMIDIVATQQGMALLNQFQAVIEKVQSLDEEVKSLRESLKTERIEELKEELIKAREDKLELMRQIGRLEARLEIEQERHKDEDD